MAMQIEGVVYAAVDQGELPSPPAGAPTTKYQVLWDAAGRGRKNKRSLSVSDLKCTLSACRMILVSWACVRGLRLS
jgi:hypothetical protein